MQVCISFSSSVCVLFSFFLSFCKLIRHSKRERNARGQKVLHFLAERHSEHSSIRRRSRRNLGVRGSKGNLLSSVRDRIRKCRKDSFFEQEVSVCLYSHLDASQELKHLITFPVKSPLLYVYALSFFHTVHLRCRKKMKSSSSEGLNKSTLDCYKGPM